MISRRARGEALPSSSGTAEQLSRWGNFLWGIVTGQDIERQRKNLFAQRQELFQELRGQNEGWDEIGTHDIESEAKAQLAELFAKLDERGQREFAEIDLALTKIVNASYGICEDCKKPIPLERLLALPVTRYCSKCSTREEEKGKRPQALA